MKIAIPVFENRISPRFDYAPGFRVYVTEGAEITCIREISCQGWNDSERIAQLRALGIDTMICGGLPNHLLGILTNRGMKIIPWVAGDASEAFALFLRGQLSAGMVICPEKKRRRRKSGIKIQK
jgi:predicted Fe-Mo cluster-binding NifX family protein